MERSAMKGWGHGQYQQGQKGVEQILGHEVHRQALKGTGMLPLSNIPSVRIMDAVRERMTGNNQPCTLHSTFCSCCRNSGLNAYSEPKAHFFHSYL